MIDTRDPGIKLFGKTISLTEHDEIPVSFAVDEDMPEEDIPASSPQEKGPKEDEMEEEEGEKDKSNMKTTVTTVKDQVAPAAVDSKEPDTASIINNSLQIASIDKENTTTIASKTEEEQNEESVSKEKTLKKPDKILPCPRCNSLDTKFCYYNNYNVNQPRHFCKNCQRYWTAGGTMRNVPVGAGRRKNKSSSSHYRHIIVSEALQTAQTNLPEVVHHTALKPNGTVLSFGSDAPLCESMASVLNIAEKTMRNSSRNGFHQAEEPKIPISCRGCENGEEHSSTSSVTASNSNEEGNMANLKESTPQNCHSFPPQIPIFPGAPWCYPWNSAQWSSPIPPPAFCASSLPISFYPAPAYWGCTIPGAWSIPWLPPPSSAPHAGSSGSGPNSPTLGKHSREGNMLKQNGSEKEEPVVERSSERSIWVPKTLRIDDPSEAARSSIWATLGIKNDKGDTISGGLFKGFQSKVNDRNHMADTSPVLQANPAALSRSLNFNENL